MIAKARLSFLVILAVVGGAVFQARPVRGDSDDLREGVRVDFTADDLTKLPGELAAVSFVTNRPAKFSIAERAGQRGLSDDPAPGGDVLYAKTPATSIEESYSFIYSGSNSVVEPFFVNASPPRNDSVEGFTTDLSASRPDDDFAGSVSYRFVDASGKVEYARKARLRTEPYFYHLGHTYRVDAIADAASGRVTARVYDIALGAQTFDPGVKILTGSALYPGLLAQYGPATILDFSFGPLREPPVRPDPARRAADYLFYLGYNCSISGPATSPLSLAFAHYFPQLLIKHVRVPDVMDYLPSINAVSRYGIDADVLTGNHTTIESLRTFIEALTLPPDAVELWNEPNNSRMGAGYDAHYQADLPPFAAQVAKAFPHANIWGPSLIPNHGHPTDAARFADSIGRYVTAWNAHSYTLGTPENLGYGGFFGRACGSSRREDCGHSGAPSFNDNVNSVINPALPGVTTEGAGSYGTNPELCGHSNVDFSTQQAYVERGMLYNFKLGHLRVYPYKFIDDGNCSDGFGTYGIMSKVIEPDGRPLITPKPAYVSLVFFHHILADDGPTARSFEARPLTYALRGAPLDVEQLLLAESDGTYRLVLWSDASLWDFNANGEQAPGRPKPLVAQALSVRFADTVNATVYTQTPESGAWKASREMRASTVGVTVNQFPLVVAIAPQTADAHPIVLPRDVPTAPPTKPPSPK